MNNIIYCTAGIIAALLAVYKARDLRRAPHSVPLRAVIGGLISLSAALLLVADGIRPIVERAVAVDGFARWAGHACALLTTCCIQITLSYFTHAPGDPPPHPRWRLAGWAITVTVLAILIFGFAPPDSDNFVDAYAASPRIGTYLIVMSSVLAFGLLDALRLSLRHVRHATSPYVRAGLITVATGAGLSLIYTAGKIAYTTARLAGSSLGTEAAFVPSFGAIGITLLVLGTIIPAAGPRAVAPFRWLWQHAAYRRLQPLTDALTAEIPQVVPAALGGHAPISLRLYQRIIEIRDAQIFLRGYVTPAAAEAITTAAHQAGLRGDQLLATTEAAKLAAGLTARKSGTKPIEVENPASPPGPTAADLHNEARWLLKLARAFTHSPIVEQARTHPTLIEDPE